MELSSGAPANPSVIQLLDDAEWLAVNGRAEFACALFRRAAERDETGQAINAYGRFLWSRGELSAARDQFRLLLRMADSRNDTGLRSVAWNNLAAIHRELGEESVAASCQQQSWRAAQADRPNSDSCRDISAEWSNRANDAILAGDLQLAERLLIASVRWERRFGTSSGEAADWGSLGIVAAMKGYPLTAARHFWRAYRLHRQANDHRGMGSDLMHLGQLYADAGRCRIAVRLLERAIRHFRRAGNNPLAAKAFSAMNECESAMEGPGTGYRWN